MRARRFGYLTAVCAVLSALLTSCGSSGGRAQHPSGGSGSAASPGATAVRPGFIVYLCATRQSAPCVGRTTAAQTSAIRRRLAADPQIVTVRYRSELDQYRAAKRQLQEKVAALMKPGDLPAAFVVGTRSAAPIAAVAARYRHLAGVSTIKPCPSGC